METSDPQMVQILELASKEFNQPKVCKSVKYDEEKIGTTEEKLKLEKNGNSRTEKCLK